MAGSGVIHAVYFAFLQRGYRDGDLSLVYPLARGTGPLLATIAAILLLGERPGAVALAGGALVVAAILSLAAPAVRARAPGSGWALATGVTIAAYTLWDKHAVGSSTPRRSSTSGPPSSASRWCSRRSRCGERAGRAPRP